MLVKTYFAGQEIPENEQYAYIIGQEGFYMLKKNGLFDACVKIDKIPDLAEQPETFTLKAKKIPYRLIKEVMVFFHAVYQQHKSEAMVLLCYEKDTWSVYVPEQEVSGCSVKYTNDDHRRVVGSIHSHPGFGTHASSTDDEDELNFDGLHLIISSFDEVKPEIACSIVINGRRTQLKSEEIIEGINEPVKMTNPEWLKKVKPKETIIKQKGIFEIDKEKTGGNGHKDSKIAEVKVTVPLEEQCWYCAHQEQCLHDKAESGKLCYFFEYDQELPIELRRAYD